MKEIQRSKEYNSKTGKWETMSFKQDRKGNVSVSPVAHKSKGSIESKKAAIARKMTGKLAVKLSPEASANKKVAHAKQKQVNKRLPKRNYSKDGWFHD